MNYVHIVDLAALLAPVFFGSLTRKIGRYIKDEMYPSG
jgi:hypothetical protein